MKRSAAPEPSRHRAATPKQTPSAKPPRPKSEIRSQKSEIVLLAVTGMSPAILTETIWALAHPRAESSEEPVIPHRVIVLTTTTGRQAIVGGLFAAQASLGGCSPWEAMRTALAAEGLDLTHRLRFGTTPDDVRVFTTADRATGRTSELDDIRTPADNEAAATFILEQVRGLVEDPDKTVIASLAGGRKTMGALLYACFSLIGRDTDRLTHVLVSEPFDTLREFWFPAQPGGLILKSEVRDQRSEVGGKNSEIRNQKSEMSFSPSTARIELADVPFVPLRHLFRHELGRPAGGFMRLVESCRAGVRERVGESLRLTLERSRPEVNINGSRLKLAPREHLVLLFLANRAKNGEPAIPAYCEATDPLNEFREALRAEAPADDWADWRLTDSLKSKFEDDQDIRRALSSLREKIQGLGGDASGLATCLPERGRFSLDMPASLIFLKP